MLNSGVTAAFRPNGDSEEWVQGDNSGESSVSIISANTPNVSAMGLVLTDLNGIVELKRNDPTSGTNSIAILSVVFYLNQ